MPRLFLDTEFALDASSPVLLSIAMVGGGREFYAERTACELAAMPPSSFDEFLSTRVLTQMGRLEGSALPLVAIADRLAVWLGECDAGLGWADIVYDYSTDFLLVEQLMLLMNRRPAIQLVPTHVGYLLDDADGEAAAIAQWREVAAARGLHRHHALADALALEARFRAVHGD